MTISSETRKAGPYVGNSVATSFAFAFKVFEKADVSVVLTVVATGVQSTLVLDTDYTVTLNADQNASPGGSVTYPVSGSPMASTHKLTVGSAVARLQEVDVINTGEIALEIIEEALDRNVILTQQLAEKIDRALVVQSSDANPSTLPSSVERASKFLAFDASGNPIASGGGLSSPPTTAFIVTLLDDTTAAAARATLGVLSSYETPVAPQGRITFTSATPVLKSTVTAQGTIYYTPYNGNRAPIYDGTGFIPTTFAELSQASTDNTKSPAATAADKVYDMFLWSDSGTMRCTRGPAWTNDTTRGYTLTRTNGILLNTSAITNGPAALRGTYVGTVFSNGSSLFDFQFGAAAANGTPGLFGLWNAYNRVAVKSFTSDTTTNWTYNSTTIRAANGSNGNRCTFVDGLSDEMVEAKHINSATSTLGDYAVGIGLDSTSAFAADSGEGYASSGSATAQVQANYAGFTGVGKHFLQAVEKQYSTASLVTYTGSAQRDMKFIADLRL